MKQFLCKELFILHLFHTSKLASRKSGLCSRTTSKVFFQSSLFADSSSKQDVSSLLKNLRLVTSLLIHILMTSSLTYDDKGSRRWKFLKIVEEVDFQTCLSVHHIATSSGLILDVSSDQNALESLLLLHHSRFVTS